jgi:hypothetical protein
MDLINYAGGVVGLRINIKILKASIETYKDLVDQFRVLFW